jgi:hypothetical protein
MRGCASIPGDHGLRGTLTRDITDGRGASSTGAAKTQMPTRKPRYALTDSGELSDQLDRARRRWPEIRDRKELLLKLVRAGHDAIEDEVTNRVRVVEETAGAFSGVYEPGELEWLRADWPK